MDGRSVLIWAMVVLQVSKDGLVIVLRGQRLLWLIHRERTRPMVRPDWCADYTNRRSLVMRKCLNRTWAQ